MSNYKVIAAKLESLPQCVWDDAYTSVFVDEQDPLVIAGMVAVKLQECRHEFDAVWTTCAIVRDEATVRAVRKEICKVVMAHMIRMGHLDRAAHHDDWMEAVRMLLEIMEHTTMVGNEPPHDFSEGVEAAKAAWYAAAANELKGHASTAVTAGLR